MHRWLLLAVSAMFAAGPATAQTAQQAYPVELSMPFGTAGGKLVTSGAYLIFVNDPNVAKSFAIQRNDVQNIDVQNGVMSIALNQPMKDESGEQSRLSFRFTNPADADSIVRWSKMGSADRSAAAPNVGEPKVGLQQISYQVKHNHRLGSCTGRLLVTADRVSFESLTDINDSRQWSMKDIKEVEHKNPYSLDIKSFTGNDYSFQFLGGSMKNEDYTDLTKAIAAARTAR
jgi:hypothetical protein